MHVHLVGQRKTVSSLSLPQKSVLEPDMRTEKPQATSCLVSTQLAAHSFVARALTYYTLTDFLAKERLLPVIYTVL